MNSSKLQQNAIKLRVDTSNSSKHSIKKERKFNDITYITDFKKYNTKLEAKTVVANIKKMRKNSKARIIERKNGIFIYFDDKTYQDIESGNLKLNSIDRKKVIPKKKGKNQTLRENLNDSNLNSTKILVGKYDFPKYLLSRFSKDAKNLMKMGIFEVYRSSKNKLDNYIDILSSEQIKFDLSYPKERKVIEYMRDLIKIFENMRIEEKEKEAKLFIKENILDKKNKFKNLSKLVEKKGTDEVSYLIYKSIKKKAKKYPLGSNNLIKKIKELLVSGVI